MNSYIHFIYEFRSIWIHIIISYMNSYNDNSYICIHIHVNYEFIWFFHIWILIWIRVYQGSRWDYASLAILSQLIQGYASLDILSWLILGYPNLHFSYRDIPSYPDLPRVSLFQMSGGKVGFELATDGIQFHSRVFAN